MRTVIEIARGIREAKAISLKMPLKELVVVHHDSSFHIDIAILETYIVEELNVRVVIMTSDEKKYGVKYRLEADFKSLGSKLKKDAMKVKHALPSILHSHSCILTRVSIDARANRRVYAA